MVARSLQDPNQQPQMQRGPVGQAQVVAAPAPGAGSQLASLAGGKAAEAIATPLSAGLFNPGGAAAQAAIQGGGMAGKLAGMGSSASGMLGSLFGGAGAGAAGAGAGAAGAGAAGAAGAGLMAAAAPIVAPLAIGAAAGKMFGLFNDGGPVGGNGGVAPQQGMPLAKKQKIDKMAMEREAFERDQARKDKQMQLNEMRKDEAHRLSMKMKQEESTIKPPLSGDT